MPSKIKDKEKILFIGDSITDCERMYEYFPLGEGYVRLVSDMITVWEPEKNITVINMGINGNTIVNLKNRWKHDVLRPSPDWLLVLIGINDIHQYLFENGRTIFSPAKYEENFRELLDITTYRLPECKIVLLEPFFMCREPAAGQYEKDVLLVLNDYLRIVGKLSVDYNTRLVKTHEIFQRQLDFHDPSKFCQEPVHPNHTGHFLIADAVYKSLSE